MKKIKSIIMPVAFLLNYSLSAAAAPSKFPLDPLDANELQKVADIIRKHGAFPKAALFPMIALNEPNKKDVLENPAAVPREAYAVILDRATRKTIEAVVNLNTGKIKSWTEKLNVQPLVLVEEYETVPKIVMADPRWQEAMKKRGITDFKTVQVDTWAASHLVPENTRSDRLLRAMTYYKKPGKLNFYGQPIEGVVALVSISQSKVIDVTDTGVVPIAKDTQDFDEKSVGKLRKIKPIKTVQPAGAGYTVRGQEVSWQNWRFRFGVHPREGLVLYTVSYGDKGTQRPVLYRAALSEMVVPYGDPDVNWSWRNAFDVGEYGVGRLTFPLEPKNDVPSQAVFFDSTFVDDFGKPYETKRTVALYERDGGLLWKHFDIYSGKNESRRAQELVLTSIASIGNYDYALSWVFHQDGTLEMAVNLTGIMLPKGTTDEKSPCQCHSPFPNSHMVAPQVLAPHHQHFFNMRLDLDVDGTANSVYEMNTESAEKGPKNPAFNGIVMKDTLLATEKSARRQMSMAQARKWKISSAGKLNGLGQNTSYTLQPGENSVPYLHPESGIRKRATFIENHFWATKIKPDEMNGAGPYPNQSNPDIIDGLMKWTNDDEALVQEDVVIWYTMGITHTPRPEEWPVMNVHKAGFKLVPTSFFDRNPAMDVPRTR